MRVYRYPTASATGPSPPTKEPTPPKLASEPRPFPSLVRPPSAPTSMDSQGIVRPSALRVPVGTEPTSPLLCAGRGGSTRATRVALPLTRALDRLRSTGGMSARTATGTLHEYHAPFHGYDVGALIV